MTWYASEIIAPGKPSVLTAVSHVPEFGGHVYHVTNPIRFAWHRPEAAHSVPDDGLVFIRAICDPAAHIADWHEDDEILRFDRFLNVPGSDVSLKPDAVVSRRPKLEGWDLPSEQVLRVAKRLAVDSKSTVAYYYCFCWGGDVEVEYSWVFGDSERVLIRQSVNDTVALNRLVEIDLADERERDEDVLVRTLSAVGCDLPTPFFAPHTRSWEWQNFRV